MTGILRFGSRAAPNGAELARTAARACDAGVSGPAQEDPVRPWATLGASVSAPHSAAFAESVLFQTLSPGAGRGLLVHRAVLAGASFGACGGVGAVPPFPRTPLSPVRL